MISLRFHLQRHPLHFSFTEAIPHHYHFQRLPHSGHSVRNTLALVEVGKNLRRSIQQSHGGSQVVTARSTSTKKPNCHVLACQQTWTWLYPKPIKCRMKTMCLQNMQMQQCPPVAILVDRFRMLQGQTHILLMVQRSCTFLVWTHTYHTYPIMHRVFLGNLNCLNHQPSQTSTSQLSCYLSLPELCQGAIASPFSVCLEPMWFLGTEPHLLDALKNWNF